MRTARRVALIAGLVALAMASGSKEHSFRAAPQPAPAARLVAAAPATAVGDTTGDATATVEARTLYTRSGWMVTEVARAPDPTRRGAGLGASSEPREREPGREALVADVARITLDRLLPDPGRLWVRPTGFDRLAPRAIELWRFGADGEAVVAVGESRADGELVLPVLVVPRDGLRLVAAPRGAGPRSPAASLERALAPRSLEPPLAALESVEPHLARLFVRPRETSGFVSAFAPDGAALGRWPVGRGTPRRGLDVDVALPSGSAEIWLFHELEDGRRSAPHVLALPAP